MTLTTKRIKQVLGLYGLHSVAPQEVEIAVFDTDGKIDREATEARAEQVGGFLGWGGYRSGWGSWIFCKGYRHNDLISSNVD